jgi:hypothetical protein
MTTPTFVSQAGSQCAVPLRIDTCRLLRSP